MRVNAKGAEGGKGVITCKGEIGDGLDNDTLFTFGVGLRRLGRAHISITPNSLKSLLSFEMMFSVYVSLSLYLLVPHLCSCCFCLYPVNSPALPHRS